jgi:hypothetical protein
MLFLKRLIFQFYNFIKRLIKVEEELKREKYEMNKLLKAKQEIIDVQKKRIEGMASRLAHTQYSQNQQIRYNTSNVKNKSNNKSEIYNGNYNHQQPIKMNHSNGTNSNIKSYSTPAVVTTSSNLNNPLLNLNANNFLRTSEL